MNEVPSLPPDFHQTLTPPEAEPPFHDPGELRATWGRVWGSVDEVGPLREVMVRPPGRELARITADAWREDAGALVDPDGSWYWTSRTPPDLERARAEHEGLQAALRAEGVTVHVLDPLDERFAKQIYTRDPLLSVPGGVVVGRLAPRMRRGEEAWAARAAAALGAPILRTITGTGLLEGGSFVKLTPRLAALGTSIRCNEEAATQLADTLRPLGVELLVVPLGGFTIHLDLHLAMLDVDRALVDPTQLPHWFTGRLRELGIEPIWALPEEPWAVNLLTLRPGRVLMSDSCPRTREMLEERGIEVVAIPYDELHHNGGGIHCSTFELARDPAGAG